MFNYKQIWIGRYEDEIEGAKAYDRKAKELFGDYAKLNFPVEETKCRESETQFITLGFMCVLD
jgi:intein/homing endonuclease